MKKWLFFVAVLTATAVLSRRPHPARDVAKLEPVQVVYVSPDGAQLTIETDTGAKGSGANLTEAAADLKAKASGEIFLDTAEYLLLDPAVSITEEFHTLLRPTCGVTLITAEPDLQAASDYLSVHPPETTLSDMRAKITQRSALKNERSLPCTQNDPTSGS